MPSHTESNSRWGKGQMEQVEQTDETDGMNKMNEVGTQNGLYKYRTLHFTFENSVEMIISIPNCVYHNAS